MSTSQALIDTLKTRVGTHWNNPNSVMHTFLQNNFAGGWESWLQVEYADAVFRNAALKAENFNREVIYPGTTLRSDLWFQPMRGAAMWVELKTQRNSTYTHTVSDFQTDVTKISSLTTEFKATNVLVAAAVLIPTAADRTALNTYRHQAPAGTLTYYAFGNGQWSDVTANIPAVQNNTLCLITFRLA